MGDVPTLLEAGLPCSSLSAECQRDNNARQRPPQNRLHIWWARRPPTICRAAILAALLPKDLGLPEEVLPQMLPEPSEADLDDLPDKLHPHRPFFERLLKEITPTPLTKEHEKFLRAMGVLGDADAAYRRIQAKQDYRPDGVKPINMPEGWAYRHRPAFHTSPQSELVRALYNHARPVFELDDKLRIRVLDCMAGGGSIPLEAIRYGLEVFANDLNPVSALLLKATTEYPAKFGGHLSQPLAKAIQEIAGAVKRRLIAFFPCQPPERWWEECREDARMSFRAKAITQRMPGGEEVVRDYFWVRIVPCTRCRLKIPISSNFYLIKKKGRPKDDLAVLPVVPPHGETCTFRIVRPNEYPKRCWPTRNPARDFHPTDTPTFKDGRATCPRCDQVLDRDEVKELARARKMGSQLYAIASQVPVKLTYKNGETKVRYMWRFRPPTKMDLDAVAGAEAELARLRPGWEARGLVPDEEIPEGEKTREPRNVGFVQWRDLFLSRQLLTILTILDEIKATQGRARQEVPPDQAEAVAVYLALMLSKVVNYNSVNTFWDYTRKKVAQTFSRHDFAFRASFCEFEGAREIVTWAGSQVLAAYDELSRMIHGEPVNLSEAEGEEASSDEGSAPEENATEEEDAEGDRGGDRAGLLSQDDQVHIRPEVIVPTITCKDAAELDVPEPGTVHLLCVDPPYYNNVQYAELSDFFYVWLKRALGDVDGVKHLFRDRLTDRDREAVANAARMAKEAARLLKEWEGRHQELARRYEAACGPRPACGVTEWNKAIKAARARAEAEAGPKPPTAADLAAERYVARMMASFRRARALLHPKGRMVVMFNHKQTEAWRALGHALIQAGFTIRSSVPVHTEAESSLNIRGLDAARSTILLLCFPREEAAGGRPNTWQIVQRGVDRTARQAAELFWSQGLRGTDLYLSSLGPALGVVSANWPVQDVAGREVDLDEALKRAYAAVGEWRLEQLMDSLQRWTNGGQENPFADAARGFDVRNADDSSRFLWLWLDAFQGAQTDTDEARKLAKALGLIRDEDRATGQTRRDGLDELRRWGFLSVEKDIFTLAAPVEVDLRLASHRLQGIAGRAARQEEVWEERRFPGFLDGHVWNAIGLMAGTAVDRRAGPQALRRWLEESGTGASPDFHGAFALTLSLLRDVYGRLADERHPWRQSLEQANRAWDLVLKDWAREG